ncbi:MAG: hypothetical protein P8Y24_03425 [Gammaproteobacteria bacterium]
MIPVALQVEQLPLTLLVGCDVPEVLQANGYDLPELMQVARLPDGFLVRTGKDEFLLQSSKPLVANLPSCWTYPRVDQAFVLQGEHWREVMAYICHMDMGQVKTDDWLMMSVAGVNAWARVLEEGLLLGCDPSLGEYLHHTLNETVNRVNEKFIK